MMMTIVNNIIELSNRNNLYDHTIDDEDSKNIHDADKRLKKF